MRVLIEGKERGGGESEVTWYAMRPPTVANPTHTATMTAEALTVAR